jgi:phosphoribosyl-ATP pyrophosphohydrolase
VPKAVSTKWVEGAICGLDKAVEFNLANNGALQAARLYPDRGAGRLSILGRDNQSLGDIREIVTSYPAITEMVADRLALDRVEIIPQSGKLEMMVRKGFAQTALDFVDTRETVRQNGLVELPTGFKSCLAFVINGEGATDRSPIDEPSNPPLKEWLASLDTLAERAAGLRSGKPPETYTERLMADENELVKKIGSESAELIRELCRPDFDLDRMIGEGADYTYALEAALAIRGASMLQVLRELAMRNRGSA